MANIDKFVARAEKAEKEIEKLALELESLKKNSVGQGGSGDGGGGENEEDVPEELKKLRQENSRLKYRLNILKRAVEKEGRVDHDGLTNISATLVSLFTSAIQSSYPALDSCPCPVLPSSKGGDYQFNGAMAIAGLLKAKGQKVAPRDVATKVVENVPNNDLIEKLEIAGPGFVNIFIKTQFIEQGLMKILEKGVLPPPGARKRVVVDFSSPNIAKEMHVGHLRSTIIGDSVCRLLEFLGHDVLRLNHIGDWGTQFGMLIAHLKDEFPNFKTESPPISDLMAFYKQSKARFDADEEFKKRAYASVVKLQAHDEDHLKAWNLICDVSRLEFQKVYDRLDVRLVERGESFYQDRMKDVVAELERQQLLEEDEGRKIMFAPNVSVPLTVVKSDGGFTYDTSDMAALRHRLEEEKADWLIYVTDAGQATHFQQVSSSNITLLSIEKLAICQETILSGNKHVKWELGYSQQLAISHYLHLRCCLDLLPIF